MARKADFFHLTSGYAAMGADSTYRAATFQATATARHSHSKKGGQARQGLSVGSSPSRRGHAGGKERTDSSFQVSSKRPRNAIIKRYRIEDRATANLTMEAILFPLTLWVLQI